MPQLQADHEPGGVQCGQHHVGVGEVIGFDTADQQGAQRPVRGGGQDAVHVTPSGGWQFGDMPRSGDLRAGRLVVKWAAAGQQGGQRAGLQRAPLAGPARHPRQPGPGGVGEPGGGQSRIPRAPWPGVPRP